MIEEYVLYLKNERNYPLNTIDSYIRDIEDFKAFIGQRRVTFKSVDKEIVRDYLKNLDALKYKNTTIGRKMSSLRNFYDFLVVREYVKNNPFKLIGNPKKDKKLPNFLQYEEFEKLLSGFKDDNILDIRDKLIIELLFDTGMRVSELINIKLKDIDFKKQSILVMGKGSKERICYYGDYGREDFIKYLEIARPKLLKNEKNYLFLSIKGTKLTRQAIESIIEKCVKKVGLNHHISPHVLRHTFATSMLDSGADIRSVSELLGHSSLSTTQIYTHVSNDKLRAEYLHCFPRK